MPSDNTQAQLEELAQIFWKILLDTGISDGHCKSYDPLTIEKEDGYYTFLSYVFDHDDGGRSRTFKTLNEGKEWLIESFKDWIDQDQEDQAKYIESKQVEARIDELENLRNGADKKLTYLGMSKREIIKLFNARLKQLKESSDANK